MSDDATGMGEHWRRVRCASMHLCRDEEHAWCGATIGTVSAEVDDRIEAVDCEACLEAAKAFGDRCVERINDLAVEKALALLNPPPEDFRRALTVVMGDEFASESPRAKKERAAEAIAAALETKP